MNQNNLKCQLAVEVFLKAQSNDFFLDKLNLICLIVDVK